MGFDQDLASLVDAKTFFLFPNHSILGRINFTC
jgi:hypothetical protein